jgi:hypothetical protein
MVSDSGSGPEPYPKPEIRRGVVLPRAGAVPGAERFSPAAVSGAGDQGTEPEGPRHRRPARSSRDRPGEPPSRRWLVLFGGLGAVACVAVAAGVAFGPGKSAHDSSSSAAGGHGPAAPDRVPPVPSWATGARPPRPSPSASASASASAHATPTPSATPHASASHPGAAPRASAHHWQTVVVHSTYVLDPGDSVHSNRLRLSLQGDGDLVLRDEDGRVTWSTGTHAQGAHAVFQDDGNLVVYRGDQTLWSSRTDGHNGATLVLGADGAMTIVYRNTTLWSTGTG